MANWYRNQKIGPLGQALGALRSQLASAAQAVYDGWTQDADGFDEEMGGGGICDQVANAMSGVIYTAVPDVEVTEGGQDGDDHAYLIVYNQSEAYEVDIPPGVYETGGGYNWRKVEGVVLGPQHVMITPLNRADFEF